MKRAFIRLIPWDFLVLQFSSNSPNPSPPSQPRQDADIFQVVLQQQGDLLEQCITRSVSTGVIDGFELIQVDVTQGVDGIIVLLIGDGVIQATLELVAVDKPCEGIMCCLQGELSIE